MNYNNIMDPRSLPLCHPRKQEHRDDRLWAREEQRVRLYALKKLNCPCVKCKGHTLCIVANVRNHLILNGKNPSIKVWRGPKDRDSLDEEWEVEFKRPIDQQNLELDL
jgi:hypothetical protein